MSFHSNKKPWQMQPKPWAKNTIQCVPDCSEMTSRDKGGNGSPVRNTQFTNGMLTILHWQLDAFFASCA